MEANKIITADLLDIIFEGRNKDYGAYELRKNYGNRITTSLLMAFIFAAGLIVTIDVLIKSKSSNLITDPIILKIPGVILSNPLQTNTRLQTIVHQSNTENPPKIVKDNAVLKPTKNNPVVLANNSTVIFSGVIEGNNIEGIAVPAIEKIIEAPPLKKPDDDHSIHQKVDVEAIYPGGERAWNEYVSKEMRKHLDELTEDGQSITVRLKFIVEQDGSVTRVEAENKSQSKLASIAIAAIKNGPKWIPAYINGQAVRAYRVQPVSFQIVDSN